MKRYLLIVFLFLITPLSAQKWGIKTEYFGKACRSAEGNMQWIGVKGTDLNHTIHVAHTYHAVGTFNYLVGRVLLLGTRMKPVNLAAPFLPSCSLYVNPLVIIPYPYFAMNILKSSQLNGMSYVAQWLVIQKVTGGPRTILAFSMTDAVQVTFVKK